MIVVGVFLAHSGCVAEEINKTTPTTPITTPATTTMISTRALYATRHISYPSRREDIGSFLEAMGLKTGAEIGVQRGKHAFRILATWPSCQKFVLVDPWASIENDPQKDIYNGPQWQQDFVFEMIIDKFSIFKEKVGIYRATSLAVAEQAIPDASLDFVYLDARHDYCAVKKDLEAWWPKIKAGGIFSGHDFIDTQDPRVNLEGWEWCEDGRREAGGVKRAVEEFAQQLKLTIATTTLDGPHVSWFIQKPFEPDA